MVGVFVGVYVCVIVGVMVGVLVIVLVGVTVIQPVPIISTACISAFSDAPSV